MNKYTLKQLQDALVALYAVTNSEDAEFAYRMVFEEVCKRMGDEAFDVWCDSVGF